MYRLTHTVLVFCLVAAAAFAQGYQVQYLEGLVEVQRGAAWHQVAPGDTVPAGSLVRLDEGAFAELAGPGATLRLARRGTYDLAKLAAADTQARSAGLGTFLTQRATALSASRDSTPRHEVGVAGVRGAAANKGGVTWVGQQDTEELLAAGTRKLASGDYKDAYGLFAEARESASGPDEGRATFYMGYAAYLGGDVAAALKALEERRPDAATAYYDDHVLVLSQVLVETFAYADAADLLQGYLRSGKAGPDNTQAARLFLGLSYKGLGNREQAAESLRAAQQPNAGAAAARAAAKLLESL